MLRLLICLLLHFYRYSSAVLLLNLLLLHAVHIVHYHLFRCDFLGVHSLLGRMLSLLQMHFLVLSARWACFSLQCLLLGHLTSQLSLRCPADCDSWFVSCTWCHLWFTNARHSHSGVLAAQVVHFNKGVLICILLGKASATVAASLWADDGMASIVWSQRPLLAYHGLAKLVVWARVFLT